MPNDARLEALIRVVPDFPKPGIQFKDITPLLRDAEGFRLTQKALAELVADLPFDLVAGVESRGFLFGAPLALDLGVGFVPVRKAGKLPAKVERVDYQLEYGSATLEVHADAVAPGQRVLIVDDLLATGGTVAATRALLERLGAQVVGAAFVVELDFLKGRERLVGLDCRALLHDA